jgi:glycosyltransferase involved in cell wall biosynthesis
MVSPNTHLEAGRQQGAAPDLTMPRPKFPPLISVVTVVFNGAKTLRETITSIIPQLCDDVEYLIIDGGSNDGTVDIIREYERHLAYWISEPDRGIYDAWNKAIDASQGEFISFVGADDILEPRAFMAYIEKIKNFPDIEYWSSSFRIVGDYEFLLRAGKNLQAGFIDVVTVTMGADGVSNKQAFFALKEARLAKISTYACSKLTATFDYIWANIKLCLHRLLPEYHSR